MIPIEKDLNKLTDEIQDAVNTKDLLKISMSDAVVEFLRATHIISTTQKQYTIEDLKKLSTSLNRICKQVENWKKGKS